MLKTHYKKLTAMICLALILSFSLSSVAFASSLNVKVLYPGGTIDNPWSLSAKKANAVVWNCEGATPTYYWLQIRDLSNGNLLYDSPYLTKVDPSTHSIPISVTLPLSHKIEVTLIMNDANNNSGVGKGYMILH